MRSLFLAAFILIPGMPPSSLRDTASAHGLPEYRSASAGSASADLITVLADGTLSVQESAEIPPYADSGRWQEGTTRSTSQFLTRHFLFLAPGRPPAMEVYVIVNRTGEPPDGVFETGMVGGYISSFSSGAGFTHEDPDFVDVTIGAVHARHCRVELSKGSRKIWLYAYILLRQPSLVFLTVRAQADANHEIEDYLARVRLK